MVKDHNNVGCITYNKEMFRDAGVAFLSETKPISYFDEFYELSQKLGTKDSSGKTLIWGMDYRPMWAKYLVSDMATAEGLSIYADKEKSVMNADPRVNELWEYWARFNLEDISSNVNNPIPGWAGAAFASERVAMVQLGYWFGASLMDVEGYEDKFGWAPTPILKSGSQRTTNHFGASGFVISATTEHPDDAFEVFEWLVAGDAAISRAKIGWGLPPLLSHRQLLPMDSEYDRVRAEIAFADANYYEPFQVTPTIGMRQFEAVWNEHMDDLVTGEIDMDTFIARYYEGLDELMKTGREELGR
jgi:multiple sugar transport system substrate-binding protein